MTEIYERDRMVFLDTTWKFRMRPDDWDPLVKVLTETIETEVEDEEDNADEDNDDDDAVEAVNRKDERIYGEATRKLFSELKYAVMEVVEG